MANLTRRELYNSLALYGDPAKAGVAKPGPKRANAAPEQAILNAILAMLRLHPKVAWVARVNSGAYKTPDGPGGKGRFIRFGFAGCGDILGQMRDGRILMLEVKSEHGRLSDAQIVMLQKVTANRGVGGMVRSVDDALAIVDGRER